MVNFGTSLIHFFILSYSIIFITEASTIDDAGARSELESTDALCAAVLHRLALSAAGTGSGAGSREASGTDTGSGSDKQEEGAGAAVGEADAVEELNLMFTTVSGTDFASSLSVLHSDLFVTFSLLCLSL